MSPLSCGGAVGRLTVVIAESGAAAGRSGRKVLIWSAGPGLVWRVRDERRAGLTGGLDVWALSPKTAAGPRWDGRGLRGRAHRQGVDGRGQADDRGVQQGPGVSGADEARGAHR